MNLSEAYKLLGRHQDSVELLEAAIAAIPEKDRAIHDQFWYLHNNLMEAYHGLGDTANTRKHAGEAERWIRAHDQADSMQLAASLRALGDYLIAIEMFADAERVLRECLAIRERKIPTDYRIASTKTSVGRALFGQQRDVDAEPLLTEGYKTLTVRRTELHPVTEDERVKAGRDLASLYDRTGRSDLAAALRKQLPLEKVSMPRRVKK